MIISYSSVTEVYIGYLLCGGFASDVNNELFIVVVTESMLSALLTDSMHTIFKTGTSDAYDVFISTSTADITKLDQLN